MMKKMMTTMKRPFLDLDLDLDLAVVAAVCRFLPFGLVQRPQWSR